MDRISNLPDELLAHMISFLATKEAVSTCVLSKRWEEVWVNLQDLDFHIPSESPARNDSLFLGLNFIDEILHRLKSPEIGKFRLNCRHRILPGKIARWISDAVRLNANEIDFTVFCMELPSSFFTCDSLTVLRLSSDASGSMTVPEVFCFPNLKSLTFMLCSPPKELTERLFRCCPKLEDLSLGGTPNHGQVYNISSVSLRVLDISLSQLINSNPPPIVFLNVPKIERLNIEEHFGVDYVVQDPLAPINASITVRCCCLSISYDGYGDRALILLKAISGARSLLLDECTTYVLSKYNVKNLPTLHHLTCLEVRIPRMCGWTLLFSVLKNTPNLEVLTVRKECDHYEFAPSFKEYMISFIDSFLGPLPEDFYWKKPHTRPTCLHSHLENIKFIGFFWMKCDMEAMKYLLRKAKVLKEVTFDFHKTGVEGEEAFCKELFDYAQASSPSSCVVTLEDNEEPEWNNNARR